MRRPSQNLPVKMPIPEGDQVIGTVIRALGASNFEIMCSDKNVRVCSIPGRLKRRFWIKEGDTVLVKPWVVQGNERGDLIWRYSIMDRDKLRNQGFEIPEA